VERAKPPVSKSAARSNGPGLHSGMPSERQPNLTHEYALRAQGYRLIAGIDEVGRGSLAGPVVAAAVVLPIDRQDLLSALAGVRDSKTLTPAQRTRLEKTIR